MEKKSEFVRIPIGLKPEDDLLLTQLQAFLQTELAKRISVSETVRIALRELAKAKGI